MFSDVTAEDLNKFLQETEQQLQRLDEDIVRLERERANPLLLQEVLRIVQELKDSCESLGYQEMAKVADAMKDIVERIIGGTQPVGTRVIDALLDSLDTFVTLREALIDPHMQSSMLLTEADATAFQEALESQVQAESRVDVAQDMAQPVLSGPVPVSAPAKTGNATLEVVAPLVVRLAMARGIVERLAGAQQVPPVSDAPGEESRALAQVVGILKEAQAHVLESLAGDTVRLQVLLLSCSGVTFAVPLDNVVQAVALDQDAPTTPGAARAFSFQGKPIPVLELDALLSTSAWPGDSGRGLAFGAIVMHGGGAAVLAAEAMLKPRELVVRRLNRRIAGAKCICGVAVLEGGEVVLVLDIAALVGAPPDLAKRATDRG